MNEQPGVTLRPVVTLDSLLGYSGQSTKGPPAWLQSELQLSRTMQQPDRDQVRSFAPRNNETMPSCRANSDVAVPDRQIAPCLSFRPSSRHQQRQARDESVTSFAEQVPMLTNTGQSTESAGPPPGVLTNTHRAGLHRIDPSVAAAAVSSGPGAETYHHPSSVSTVSPNLLRNSHQLDNSVRCVTSPKPPWVLSSLNVVEDSSRRLQSHHHSTTRVTARNSGNQGQRQPPPPPSQASTPPTSTTVWTPDHRRVRGHTRRLNHKRPQSQPPCPGPTPPTFEDNWRPSPLEQAYFGSFSPLPRSKLLEVVGLGDTGSNETKTCSPRRPGIETLIYSNSSMYLGTRRIRKKATEKLSYSCKLPTAQQRQQIENSEPNICQQRVLPSSGQNMIVSDDPYGHYVTPTKIDLSCCTTIGDESSKSGQRELKRHNSRKYRHRSAATTSHVAALPASSTPSVFQRLPEVGRTGPPRSRESLESALRVQSLTAVAAATPTTAPLDFVGGGSPLVARCAEPKPMSSSCYLSSPPEQPESVDRNPPAKDLVDSNNLHSQTATQVQLTSTLAPHKGSETASSLGSQPTTKNCLATLSRLSPHGSVSTALGGRSKSAQPSPARRTRRRNIWHPVFLRIYDVTAGKATKYSKLLLGKTLEGVWHTSVLVYGFEYFYGREILRLRPSEVLLWYGATPNEEIFLGESDVTQAEFEQYLSSIADVFGPHMYHIETWNCNHFTNACLWMLLDMNVPKHILEQSRAIGETAWGRVALLLARLISYDSSRGSERPQSPCTTTDPQNPADTSTEPGFGSATLPRLRS